MESEKEARTLQNLLLSIYCVQDLKVLEVT